ncbi:MAG: aminopeptidase 1-like [Bacteroidota bacterium]|jgi:aminopeptidase N|nr:aminopeptidase 1-like [Bacteroidota bacterium]
MNYKYLLVTVSIFGSIACSSSKKISSTPITTAIAEPAIDLDTIRVFAEEPPKKKVYRATPTKSSDIIHTKLWVSFDWQKSQLVGKAEILAKPYFYPSNMLYLNARGMEIKSVKLSEKPVKTVQAKKGGKAPETQGNTEKPVTYEYENDSIKINLGKEYTAQESYIVTIEYISKPNELKEGGSGAISSDKGLYFINPTGSDPDKMPQIWTQGETQSNSAWFPTIDNPTEKMTNEIFMTVDDKYTTLSNGLLKESKKNSDGTRTDHWVMDLPHAPYLVMMGVGEFKKVTDEPWNGKEVSYYVEKEYEPHAKAIFGKTKKMMEFYSSKLGVPYAWQKYAQIVVRDYVSGAMENTSATLHGDFVCYQTTREIIDGAKGESTIAHELFHQWFGDLASCESWSNLTLNESFATYGEYLWEEFEYGRDAADDHHASSRFGYFAQSNQKQVDLVRFDYAEREDMFDAFSYNKGGQILHMLRKYVGDDAFFASLKLYLEKFKFKTAEAHDLRLAFEEVTGEDMNWFFNQWYFAKGHPELEIKKNYDAATKQLSLEIVQQHDFNTTPLYKLPVFIDVYAGGQKTRHKIWIDDVKNSYTFSVTSAPDLVNFDAERQLLAKTVFEKSKAEYIFQYKNARLWGDRKEALDYFISHADDGEIMLLLQSIAQNDPWKKFRSDAISAISDKAKGKESELKPLLISISEKDPNTKVRAAAIKALSANFKGSDLDALYEKALNEQSYAIVSEGFDAIAKNNPEMGMKKALTLENEMSKEIIYSIADLYAKHGTDDNHAYFKKVKKQFNGFELMAYGNLYGKFLKRCTKPETAIEGAQELAKMGASDSKYVKYAAQKVMKDNLLNVWQEKEDKLKSKLNAQTTSADEKAKLTEELKTVSDTKAQILTLYNSIRK